MPYVADIIGGYPAYVDAHLAFASGTNSSFFRVWVLNTLTRKAPYAGQGKRAMSGKPVSSLSEHIRFMFWIA